MRKLAIECPKIFATRASGVGAERLFDGVKIQLL
jgi:hypothetical protein